MRSQLTTLTLLVLMGLGLTACGVGADSAEGDTPSYVPSTDEHPCLEVTVSAPDVIELGAEATAHIDVNNRCDETVTYDGSVAPYHLQLVSTDDKIVWFTPSEAIPALPVEYAVAANGTNSYEAPVKLPSDSVLPGDYRVIAKISVGQDTPDTAQYVEPLKLESKPQNVSVEP